MTLFTVRPADVLAEKYRAAGVWRNSDSLGDLRRWRDETPDAIAIREYRSDGGRVEISYAELARRTERFAGALYELGVRPGMVIALQLPSWWQAAALSLAAARLGAVVAPILPTLRPRELERTLIRVGATVCLTVDRWAGFDHAAALREMAPRLQQLHHRVVLGRPTGDEIEFASFFEDTPWERRHPVALDDAVEDPDRVAVILFTTGTSGDPKGALHTENTVYASVADISEMERVTRGDVFFSPHSLLHVTGRLLSGLSLVNGACMVLLDSWSGERGLAVLAEAGVTQVLAAPSFVYDLIAATGGQRQVLPALRMLASGATSIPRQLVSEVPSVFGLPLRAAWGMTEVGVSTFTRKDDPPDWAAHSDGRPSRALELELRSDTEITRDHPGRLFARGAGVCLATVGRDSGTLTVLADHDDGWYDTGDLAVPDGRGGIRMMGRASDRIGGALLIPVTDVESELRDHPGIEDVALVGYPDGQGDELACAVIVPATTPSVTLDELRKHLIDQGMTDWYLPSRLEEVARLPRNDIGKVRKEVLRRWLLGEAELPSG
ncbi:AMP-binding protein [Pseudonocardia sp. CA-142604]|uniref:AMP-binding protein n=1 Tax=Pseudonocardia sp. CA-142604 TaxID=3240024 RepID=UPI003D8E1043